MSMRVIVDALIAGSSMCRNVFTVDASPTANPSDAAIETYLDNIWHDGLLLITSSRWVSSRVIIEFPSGVGGAWQYNREFTYGRFGGRSDDALPNQVAAVIVGITPSRRRGKKFFYGITEGYATNGLWNAEAMTALNESAAAYVTPITDGGTDYDVGVCKPDGSDFLAFNSYRVDSLAGTQRRRKPGVGV